MEAPFSKAFLKYWGVGDVAELLAKVVSLNLPLLRFLPRRDALADILVRSLSTVLVARGSDWRRRRELPEAEGCGG